MSGDSVYTEPCFVLITRNNCQLCRPQAGLSNTQSFPVLFYPSFPPPFWLMLNEPYSFILIVAVIWKMKSEAWGFGGSRFEMCWRADVPLHPWSDHFPPTPAWGALGLWVQATHQWAWGAFFLSMFNSRPVEHLTHHNNGVIPGECGCVPSGTHCDLAWAASLSGTCT